MAQYGATDKVRRAAAEQYIEPARKRGERTIKIHSGVFGRSLVERDVLEANSFPIVCNALQSKIFLRDNYLSLEEVQGPPSGKSSTVTFVYRIESLPDAHQSTSYPPEPHSGLSSSPAPDAFLAARGILKDVYRKLGGAEAFHRAEREKWDQ